MKEDGEFETMKEWAEWALETYNITKEAFDKEPPEHREKLEWMFPVFEKGRRRCQLVREEWDFRKIEDLDQARRVCKYEYRREVLRNYEFETDCMKLVGKYHPDVVILKLALENKWPQAPDVWLLLSNQAKLFPTPWLKLPAEIRNMKFESIRAVYANSFDEEDRKYLGYREHAHSIVIRWDRPEAEIIRDFGKLISDLRPPDLPKIKPLRGKRIARPFDELKWLSAWRLAASGMSYEQAQAFLNEHASGNDPHGVVPRYASSGAWQSHALDKASRIVAQLEKSKG